MSSWSRRPRTRQTRRSGAVLVRDGFSFLAFLLPPLWLLWHRLWIEAALAFAAGVGADRARRDRRASASPARCCRCWSRSMSGWKAPALAHQRAAPARLARMGRGRGERPGRGRDTLFRRRQGRRERRAEAPPHSTGPVAGAACRRPARRSACSTIPEGAEMRVAIIDYGSGNLRSATKAFERAAREAGIAAEIDLTADAGARAHRRPHRAAGRRRLCRLRGRAACRRRHVGGGRGGGDRQGAAVPRHLRRHAADVRARAGEDRDQGLRLDRGRREGDRAGRPGAEDPADRLEHDST